MNDETLRHKGNITEIFHHHRRKKGYEYHYKFLSVPICCPFYMIREESGSALGGENLLE